MTAEGPNASNQFKAPPTLDQFESYKEFVETILWPVFEKAGAQLKKLVDEMWYRENNNTWDEEIIEKLLAQIQTIKKSFYEEVDEPLNVIRTKFGPIIRNRASRLGHDSRKILSVINSRLMERRTQFWQ